jgi:hypothetical protein
MAFVALTASFIPFVPGTKAPNFLAVAPGSKGHVASSAMYDSASAAVFYRNFLDWLFQTFYVDEASWRREMVARLGVHTGASVLVTGCGLATTWNLFGS